MSNTIAAFEEVSQTIQSITYGPKYSTSCPFPCGYPTDANGNPTVQVSLHYFATATPGNGETCQCGRYFYEAAVALMEAEMAAQENQ